MNLVGQVGRLIYQGAYSVATPFHPFGGAVDIIVVEQQDGTYRSTPWYAQFGTFQGVLQGAEKIVTISVNGVEANFHMYLDESGAAYFMREVTSGAGDEEANDQVIGKSIAAELSRGDEFDKFDHGHHNANIEGKEEIDNEEYGHQDDRSSQENAVEISGCNDYHYGSLDEVENMVVSSEDVGFEMLLVRVDGHVLTAPISSNKEHSDSVHLTTPQFHLVPGESSSEDFCPDGVPWEAGLFGDLDSSSLPKDRDSSTHQLEGFKEVLGLSVFDREAHVIANADTGSSSQDVAKLSKDDTFKSCLDFKLMSQIEEGGSEDLVSPSARLQTKSELEQSPSFSDKPAGEAVAGDRYSMTTGTFASFTGCDHPCNEVLHPGSIDVKVSETKVITESEEKGDKLGDSDLPGSDDKSKELEAIEEMTSDVKNLAQEIFGDSAVHSVCHDQHEKNEHVENVSGNAVRIEEGREPEVEGSERNPAIDGGSNAMPSSPSHRWRLWPISFRSFGTLQPSNGSSANEELLVDSESGLQSPHSEQSFSSEINQSLRKQFVHNKVPTNEEIASLNLKNGKNMITFSFPTKLPSKEQVGPHFFDHRVSEYYDGSHRIQLVNRWMRVSTCGSGTLGLSSLMSMEPLQRQVMPLVGIDWTQAGVAQLFSAIKENGYQLLFLSARAIVQAYLTRSFLLNLKQDGKGLPSGPIVISPDGLFPALYREVVQRAPHEFKIACLEDIRALFPSEYNPFYAGFGNRDTDELSYRKIGIQKERIFIINPRGEVAINHCNVKSYNSLLTLVNDMFPPTSLVKEEE